MTTVLDELNSLDNVETDLLEEVEIHLDKLHRDIRWLEAENHNKYPLWKFYGDERTDWTNFFPSMIRTWRRKQHSIFNGQAHHWIRPTGISPFGFNCLCSSLDWRNTTKIKSCSPSISSLHTASPLRRLTMLGVYSIFFKFRAKVAHVSSINQPSKTIDFHVPIRTRYEHELRK